MSEKELPISRTRLKQQAKEIERLAGRLLELPEAQFSRILLPEAIREEAQQARVTSGRGSRKRELKYLAGLLRKDADAVAALEEQLGELDQVRRSDKREFHQLEGLRDRLCEADQFEAASQEVAALLPQIDQQVLGRLARSVHEHGDKRAAREIFRRLRKAMEEQD